MSTVEEKLIDASKSGGVGEVKALLRDNPGLNINWGDWRQFTALHWAANNGHAEVVKLLLAHPEISVNVTDSDGFTPFLLACQEGQVSVVRMLLEILVSIPPSLTRMIALHCGGQLLMHTMK